MSDKIELRALQITSTSREGEEWFDLHDPSGIAPDVQIPRELGAVLAFFDGKRDAGEIAAILKTQGHEITLEWLENLILELDDLFLLDSPRFAARKSEIQADSSIENVRNAAFAGRSYPENSERLRVFLEAKALIGSQRLPAARYDASKVRGIVTPHIDFHRGGHVEAASYAPLLENVRATGKRFDTLVILGIAHQGVSYPFCAATQDFATPFGTALCDREFLGDLQEIVGPKLTREQSAHQNEHSIEFSAVFCQMFDELHESKIVPILCGGFWESLRTRQLPETAEPEVAQFIEALRQVTQKHEKSGRKIGFIASVDGAHVGTQFGDKTRLTPEKLAEIAGEDAAWILALESGDKTAFHAHFAKNSNLFNVDAHPALYAFLSAFPDLRAQKLDYDQAFHPDQNIVVSFASLALFAL